MITPEDVDKVQRIISDQERLGSHKNRLEIWNDYIRNKKYPDTACFECGRCTNIHYHHVIPRILGGRKTVPLCLSCHSIIHNINLREHKTLTNAGLKAARARGIVGGRPKSLNEETSKKAIELYKEKKSVTEICKILNTSRATFYRTLKESGDIKPRTKSIVDRHPDVSYLLKLGYSLTDTQKKTGKSLYTVYGVQKALDQKI